MNKRILHIILAIAGLITSFAASAQTDGQLSQYWAVPTLYNPAAAGSGMGDMIRLRGGARMQWVGIDHAPMSFLLAGDMPFKLANKRLGVGIVAMQESAGLYKSLAVGAQISYKLRKLGGEWSAGLQIGMYDQSFKGSEVYLPGDDDYHEGSDEAIPTQDIHGTALDLAAGLRYEHKWFYAGVGCTHLTSPTITMNAGDSQGGSETAGERRYEFQASRTLYFTAGSNIPIKNTLFEIMPSVIVKSDFTFTSGQLDLRGRWKKFLSLGVGYRWNEGVVVSLGAEIKNFYLGYSYDYATNAIHKASSGSHELLLGYALKLNFSDKNRNRHKSIRIM
ncbi:MAG: PorP/SprF family type IX secretion system membrane protein [Muribaculaceae bacterium]|nr:PorP/SprF family type IX secretion system membrane protein [Muribaculaceae bacterium]